VLVWDCGGVSKKSASNSACETAGHFFSLPLPSLSHRVIVALATVANLPFLKQMSHLVGN